jgi:hypothetical protein
MSEQLQGAIDFLVGRIEQKAQELAEQKRTVNALCREAGREAMYPDAELAGTTGGLPSLRASQFYGKTPTVAAREYLDKRADAVSLEEILEALQRGGFDFDSQGWKEDARLRNLGISLGKNSSIFHRLPNGTWGLTKWYPNVKQKKAAAKANETAQVPVSEQKEENGEAGEAEEANHE